MNVLEELPMVSILVLTYHEITEDPRVFKQARALAKAGHSITAISDRPEGYAAAETCEGIDVKRVVAFDPWAMKPDDMEFTLDYVRSGPKSRELLTPLLTHTFTRPYYPPISARLKEVLEAPRFQKAYYRNASGLSRMRRKAEHIAFKSIAKLRLRSDENAAAKLLKKQAKAKRDLNMIVREMAQCNSFIFAKQVLQVELKTIPDIVHAHDLYTLPAALLLKKKYGCKVVYDAHEIETARASKIPEGGEQYVDDLELDCLEHVDALVTVSYTIADFYAQRFDGPHPTVVMNAPEVSLTNEQAREQGKDIRSLLGLGEEVPLLVYTGGIQRENRGLDKVAQALTELPDVHLVTVGPRHHINDEWLRNHAEVNKVSDRIHLVDAVPADEVGGVISSADCAIIPIQGVTLSYQLAMPNKLFEAATAQMPIVVSDLPDMRAFVEELGIGRAISENSPKGIAETVKIVLNNKTDYAGRRDYAQIMHKQYSWSAQVERLLHLYQDLTKVGQLT